MSKTTPASGLLHVTPNDNEDITDHNGKSITARGILIGTDGVIKLTVENIEEEEKLIS